MSLIQLRTADDATQLTRLDFGAVDAGVSTAPLGTLVWNDKPIHVTGDAIGTGDGATVSFPLAHAPVCEHANAPTAVYLDGTPASGYAIDYSEGVVVFTTAPASGKIVTADYWYSAGTSDASAVVLTMEQVKTFGGDGTKRVFDLPVACLYGIEVRVGSTLLSDAEWDIVSNGTQLSLASAPSASAIVTFIYIDATCQGGYYEGRSDGVLNPFSRTGFADDAESTYYKFGGIFDRTSYLVGTGNGAKTEFDTGTPLIREITQVTVGGAATTDYSVNNVTGKITFGTAPANNAEVRMTYKYERGHRIGNIVEWAARKAWTRVNMPWDAPNQQLTAALRVIAQ